MSGSNKTVKNLRKLEERRIEMLKAQSAELKRARNAEEAARILLVAGGEHAEKLAADLQVAKADLATVRVELERRRGVDRELHDANATNEVLAKDLVAVNAEAFHLRKLLAEAEAERDRANRHVARLDADAKTSEKAERRLQRKQGELDAANKKVQELETTLRAERAAFDVMRSTKKAEADEVYDEIMFPIGVKCTWCAKQFRCKDPRDEVRCKNAMDLHVMAAHADKIADAAAERAGCSVSNPSEVQP